MSWGWLRACIRRPTLTSFCFQAEDGIRGYKVTGVQTCALPISKSRKESERVAESPGQRIVQFGNQLVDLPIGIQLRAFSQDYKISTGGFFFRRQLSCDALARLLFRHSIAREQTPKLQVRRAHRHDNEIKIFFPAGFIQKRNRCDAERATECVEPLVNGLVNH